MISPTPDVHNVKPIIFVQIVVQKYRTVNLSIRGKRRPFPLCSGRPTTHASVPVTVRDTVLRPRPPGSWSSDLTVHFSGRRLTLQCFNLPDRRLVVGSSRQGISDLVLGALTQGGFVVLGLLNVRHPALPPVPFVNVTAKAFALSLTPVIGRTLPQ